MTEQSKPKRVKIKITREVEYDLPIEFLGASHDKIKSFIGGNFIELVEDNDDDYWEVLSVKEI